MPRFFHLRWLPRVASSSEEWKGGLHRVSSKRSPGCSRPLKMCRGSGCWRSSMAAPSWFDWTMARAEARAVPSISAPVKCQPYSLCPISG
ncbi:hypothetical protein D3C76_1555190 [compost metagenome]